MRVEDSHGNKNIAIRIAGRTRGSPQAVTDKARESLVLELLREERISQGQASHLLGVSRWDVIELMSKYHIPTGPETIAELHEELRDVNKPGLMS